MATVKKPAPAVSAKAAAKVSAKGQAPMAPEAGGGAVKKRKRLAKVFKRPLDKTLRSVSLVREKFSLPEGEYEQLLEMKQRLSDHSLPVKKSELVRAGIRLLDALGEKELLAVLDQIPTLR